MSCDYSNYKGN